MQATVFVPIALVGFEISTCGKAAADKKAKDDAKNGSAALQSIQAEPEEPEFVPEERVRPGAEPTAESVFGKND